MRSSRDVRERGCEESRGVERVQPGVGNGNFVVSMFLENALGKSCMNFGPMALLTFFGLDVCTWGFGLLRLLCPAHQLYYFTRHRGTFSATTAFNLSKTMGR